jgi:hypothetical protein
MDAIGEGWGGECPVARGIGDRFSELGCAVENDDGDIGIRFAGEGGRGVVGQVVGVGNAGVAGID